MTLRAVDIPDHQTVVNLEAADILRRYLAMAESGQILDLVLVARCEGSVKVVSTQTANLTTRVGMLEIAKMDMVIGLQRDEGDL